MLKMYGNTNKTEKQKNIADAESAFTLWQKKNKKIKLKRSGEDKRRQSWRWCDADVQSSPCLWDRSSRRRTLDGSSRWRKVRSIGRHTAPRTPSLSLPGKRKDHILKVRHKRLHTFIRETIPPPSTFTSLWSRSPRIQSEEKPGLRQPEGRISEHVARITRRTLRKYSPFSQRTLHSCPWASLSSSRFSSVTCSWELSLAGTNRKRHRAAGGNLAGFSKI